MSIRRRTLNMPSDRRSGAGLAALRGSVDKRLSERAGRIAPAVKQSADFSAPARPRILFVGRSTSHLVYFESIITALIARGADVEILFDRGWTKKQPAGLGARLDEFKRERPEPKTGWLVRRGDKWRDFLFGLRELRSYRSYLIRKETTNFYVERQRAYVDGLLAAFSKTRWLRALLKTPPAGWAMTALERLAPSDRGVRELIKQKNPNAVIVSPANMRFSEETDYLKAAKRLGVLTALPVLSWDNLSTKGLIQSVPDMLFVWNRAQYDDAVQIHKIPPRKIAIAGAPFFDKWFEDAGDIADRKTFCQRLGLDPARRILLYLGSSANIARDESWFVEAVARRLAKSDDPQLAGAQIVIRPHPANAKIFARLEENGYRVRPRNGALPETRAAFKQMREVFRHVDAALSINTSAMVDAVLADLPVFSVRIERYDETQSRSRHFRQLVEAGAICVTRDAAEFESKLATLFAGADQLAGRRRAFRESFARPCGIERPAGDVIAEAVFQSVMERRHG
ncbi:MAG: hypothetical protein ACE5FO_09640 [Parvularculaceae bacterium]